jgi:hypothetical protein
MRALLIALATSCVLAISMAASSRVASAADESQANVTGVLIDQACGAKMMKKDNPEKAAAGHPKSCATKESCEKSGYAVISGKRMLKFDDSGNKLAKDFLAKTDKEKDLRVTVHGTESGDEIHVTSVTPAEEK